MAIQLNVSPEGRLTLPTAIRTRLGVEGGGTLVVEVVENGVLLRSVTQAIEQTQVINRKHFAGNTEASVDAFLAVRTDDNGE